MIASAPCLEEPPLMPFYVLGGIPPALPASPRLRAALLRSVTIVGGPLPARAHAEEFVHGFLAAQRQHTEAMIGVALPAERYTIGEGVDLVAAICSALGLSDPRER